MSFNRWTGLSEGKDAVLFNRAPQPLFLYWFRNQVDRPCKYRFKLSAQSIESPKISKAPAPRLIGQTHHHIDVGAQPVFAARDRTDHGQACDAGPLELAFVRAQRVDDLILAHEGILHDDREFVMAELVRAISFSRALRPLARSSGTRAFTPVFDGLGPATTRGENYAPALAFSMKSGRSAFDQSGIAAIFFSFSKISACSCM
jgi:hypothetical protein